MKKVVFISIVASSLFAGSNYGGNYTYNAPTQWSQPANVYANQSPVVQTHQKQVRQLYIQPQPVQQVVQQTKVYRPQQKIIHKMGCQDCWNTYSSSLDIYIGQNYFGNDNLDDALTAGIRWNKCISNNYFMQLGYERVFNAEYKKVQTAGTTNTTGSSKNSRATGDSTTTTEGEISFNRFYLNGMYEFTNYNKLYPYLFAGLGYETVSEEVKDIEGQAFVQGGLGLRYKLGTRYSIIGEGKALKRFDSDDVDYTAILGFGIAFGKKPQRIVPVQAIHRNPTVHLPTVIPPSQAVLASPQHQYATLQTQPVQHMIQRPQHMQPAIASGAYYIQMGAFRQNYLRSGKSNYINRIQASGLRYTIKETMRNGRSMRLLLVGPYPSSNAARTDLHKAKSIVRGAFVKKIIG